MIEKLFSNANYAMSKSMLDMAAARHSALAANIANVETPGYKRVDISNSFLQELQQQFKTGQAPASSAKPIIETDSTAKGARADGNNVQLDNELLQLGSNELQYETLTNFVSSSLAQLKTAITGNVT
jgi:flagellar basal-body rod protein FlgB